MYLRNGWSVIPIRPRAKEPLIPWTEFQKRRATEEEVRRWFTDNPTANVGLVTGAISGFIVVDIDGAEGAKSARALKLYSPMTAMTGKPEGKHLYYAHGGKEYGNTCRRWAGIDTRADGGYVLAPPSIHPSGRRYQWMAGSQVFKSLPEFPASLFNPAVRQLTGGGIGNPQGWMSEALANLKEGNRDDTFFKIASRLRRENWNDKDAFAFLCPHADRVGFTRTELQAKIDNAWSRYTPVSKESRRASIRTGAGGAGTIDPISAPLTIRSFANAADVSEYESRKAGLREVSDFTTGYPTFDRLTGGFHRKQLFTLAARTGAGKTNWLVGAARHLCNVGKKVLLFSAEMPYDEIWDRYLAVVNHFGERPSSLFQICDEFSTDIDRVRAYVESFRPDIFIFDHINHVGTEHDELSEFMWGLHQLAYDYDIPGIVAAQLNRSADWEDYKTKQKVVPRLSMIKGSGTIEEESAQVLLLSGVVNGPDQKDILGNLDKNRYGEEATINFALKKRPYRMEEVHE